MWLHLNDNQQKSLKKALRRQCYVTNQGIKYDRLGKREEEMKEHLRNWLELLAIIEGKDRLKRLRIGCITSAERR